MKSGKVVLVGDGACGKTCLLEVSRNNKFPRQYVPTIVDTFSRTIEFEPNHSISLSFWDTAGQEDYDTLRPLTYQGTDLVILCYSIEHVLNFTNIKKKWMKELESYCPGVDYYLVALKGDLRTLLKIDKSDFVSYSDGEKLAKEINAVEYMECSALKRINVDELFKSVAAHIYKKKKNETPPEYCCSSLFGCY